MSEEIFQLQNNDNSMSEEISDLQNNVTEFTAQLETYKQETITEFTEQLETYKQETEPSCESGWLEFAGHCYFFSTFALNWRNAMDMCLSRQSHLAVINSAEEQDFLAKQSNGRWNWIGLTDEGTVKRFRWIDGTPYSYQSWKPGQPDSGGREHCAHLWHGGKWNDNACSSIQTAICEKRMK
ncbi:C-type lectin domain family 4 member G-like [Hyperolius riggenbachi]|uniref:C-type lectin domain family 4 member G-like n=1 Tax=Hyperolius riggenbachi TaxID=752182 RepID=UPI0035A380E7